MSPLPPPPYYRSGTRHLCGQTTGAPVPCRISISYQEPRTQPRTWQSYSGIPARRQILTYTSFGKSWNKALALSTRVVLCKLFSCIFVRRNDHNYWRNGNSQWSVLRHWRSWWSKRGPGPDNTDSFFPAVIALRCFCQNHAQRRNGLECCPGHDTYPSSLEKGGEYGCTSCYTFSCTFTGFVRVDAE